MTQIRWKAEKAMMRNAFPSFTPYLKESGYFGFVGYIRGSRTARTYEVVLEAYANRYPSYPPNIYIEPKLSWHWLKGGMLCTGDRPWNARNNFANHLIVVVEYLELNDGQ